MRDVSVKSSGQLVDELVTNAFKTAHAADAAEFDERYQLLRAALEVRLGADVADLIHDLAVASLATWQAQEIVMSDVPDSDAARAARMAQHLNARRTRAIREIDRVLGDAGITITTKTYG